MALVPEVDFSLVPKARIFASTPYCETGLSGERACVRGAAGITVTTEHREFATTTAGLVELSAWLTEAGCTHVAMVATGVYWKPVWHILGDEER